MKQGKKETGNIFVKKKGKEKGNEKETEAAKNEK